MSALKLRDVMRTQVPTATREEPATRVWDRMSEAAADHVVVVDEDGVAGVVSWHDLTGPNGGRHRRMGRRVGELIHQEVVTASPGTTVAKAAATMRKLRIGCLPVLDRGKLVGIVSTREMLGILAGDHAN
jgi:acetoin utilization protein AcuB